ncbi:MAG: flagellar basal body protein [Nitrospira sp.]|nr:flagellar basal body protein [Nitrospira sp.]
MISAIHTALSGMTAFTRKIEVTAHNVANVNTDGFKKAHTDFVEVSAGGVEAIVQQDDSPGSRVPVNSSSGAAQRELSNVNLGEEAVSMILSQRGFEANLKVLHTSDHLLGSVLDIKK